jgi:hypothetical protein
MNLTMLSTRRTAVSFDKVADNNSIYEVKKISPSKEDYFTITFEQ